MKKFFLLLAVSFLFFSCYKASNKIVFDSSSIRSVSPKIEWALILSPYAPIYESTDFQSSVVAHGRRGDVLEVVGNKTTKENDKILKWIAVEEGWILKSDLELYQNQLRAMNASTKLR